MSRAKFGGEKKRNSRRVSCKRDAAHVHTRVQQVKSLANYSCFARIISNDDNPSQSLSSLSPPLSLQQPSSSLRRDNESRGETGSADDIRADEIDIDPVSMDP